MPLKYLTLAAISADIVNQAEAMKTFKSGEIETREAFTYGKFVARIKNEEKLGTYSSFFTFWRGDDQESWNDASWS